MQVQLNSKRTDMQLLCVVVWVMQFECKIHLTKIFKYSPHDPAQQTQHP